MGAIKQNFSLLLYFILLILITLLFRVFVFDIYVVKANSMRGTLLDGDKVFLNKWNNSFSRNEILIFSLDDDVYIKRCIGLPNDTIEIRSGIVIINNTSFPNPSTVLLPKRSSDNKRHNAGNTKPGYSYQNDFDIMINDYYGKSWTNDNFGPLIIPKAGLEIKLTPENLSVYKDIIISEGEIDIDHIDQLINQQYVFKNDYYFMLGDNRQMSRDSRTFGPINKKNILGKSIFLLYSSKDLFNKNRLLRTIH